MYTNRFTFALFVKIVTCIVKYIISFFAYLVNICVTLYANLKIGTPDCFCFGECVHVLRNASMIYLVGLLS